MAGAEAAIELVPGQFVGALSLDPAAAPLPGATRYVARDVGDGMAYTFAAGALAGARYLVADMQLEGVHLAVFRLRLRECDAGREFSLTYGLLNQCAARMRMPLEAVDQDRWMYPREGAWLKPLCGGDRVDLRRVDRMEITVLRKGPEPVRWCMTPVAVSVGDAARLTAVRPAAGPLLDELGQSTLRTWPGKSRDADEVTRRLRGQLAAAPHQRWPEGFSRWGGWAVGGKLAGSGFFRTHHDGRRWWLVDPDGHRYWSTGPNCVDSAVRTAYDGLAAALTWLPEPHGDYAEVHDAEASVVNYLGANLIRAFGARQWRDRWADVVLGLLRQAGFTTVGNWSDWRSAGRAGFPYTRPLTLHCGRTPLVCRDFPDVFHPDFAADAAGYAEALRETRDDPALVGYFLMNEPTWGFATESPAAGMLHTTRTCATRRVLRDFLADRYGDDAGLAAAWGGGASLGRVAEGVWRGQLGDRARADLEEFSTVMVARLFGELTAACRRVDPHHLNLGVRYHTVPPDWALAGMADVDVFSVNCYRDRVAAAELAVASDRIGRPVLVGEWHFGALDAGLPATGIGRVRDQSARAQAFRVYLEGAAAEPWCVGAHYFTLYDQSALGRFDGENYHIGLVDICHRPYEPLLAAARASHTRMYGIAAGEVEPYRDAPEYLPKLFL